MSSSQSTSKRTSKPWKAVIGLTLPDGSRVEAGELLPTGFKVPKWLIEQGKVTR